MNITIVPVFGTHSVRVVGSGHIAPIVDERNVFSGEDLFAHGVDFLHGRSLHGIREPSGQISLGIGPGDCLWHGDFIGRLAKIASFGDGEEFVIVLAKPIWNKSIHEIKNAGIFPLVLTESFEIHEKIDEITAEAIVV